MRHRSCAPGKLIAVTVMALGCAVVMCSCRAASITDLSLKSDPFLRLFKQDYASMTRADAAAALTNYRVRPATTLTGKRDLTLADCRSLALGNNLEIQVARLEELTKNAVQYSARTKLLPRFLFSADLSQRDTVPYSYSDPSGIEGNPPQMGGGGTGVNVWSTGHERSTWRYVLETRWSPSDAALAYYLTRSAVNDAARTHFQRVRIAQKLLGSVESSFFRVLALQKCIPLAEQLVQVRAGIVTAREKGVEKKLESPDDFHRAKRRLVTARGLVNGLTNELEKERNELASAMGISPDYCVDGGFFAAGELAEPLFHAPMCELEMIAVQNRPEAYQAGLNLLNSQNDLRRTIIKYFPTVTGYFRATHDKDKYIFYKEWSEVGMLVYFDFVEWLGNLNDSRAIRYTVEKTQKEMGAVALGISSQVRLAALKYYNSCDDLRNAGESLGSAKSLLNTAENRYSANALDKVSVEEAKAEYLQDLIRRTRALGESQATLAELQSTMGTNYNEPAPSGHK